MQSFLAYRRFRRLVKDQYERDCARAEALNRGNEEAEEPSTGTSPLHHQQSIDDTSSVTANDIDRSLDAEKGDYSPEDSNAVLQDSQENQGGHDATESGTRLETRPTVRQRNSFGTRMGQALTGIEVKTLTREMIRIRSGKGKLAPLGHEKPPERETVFVVNYESDTDLMNPHNWSYGTRIGSTVMIASIGFVVGFASSIDSSVVVKASIEFHVSQVAELCATGLYLIGFGVGALFAGPISETVGRNPVYIVTMVIYMIWIMASGLAPNFGAQLVFRFLAGFFGSTPLTCAGGSISDLWSPMERVYAFPVFANAAFMGPIFGPVVGGFIAQSNLSWRWTEWITLMISGLVLLMIAFFQPETYAPILLKWKASHLRRLTNDDRYVAQVEIRADTLKVRLIHALYRPFILFFQEWIVVAFAFYLTIVYIILFTFLDGYDVIFGKTYGFSEGFTGTAFLGIAIGLCLASALIPLIHHWAKRDLAKVRAEGGDRLPPEERLWFAMFGAPALPISLFWMGWTTYSNVSYWSPLASSVLFGYGILCIFISSYQYIIDSYEMYAASALASLTLIRYVAAGGMTVVGKPFYDNDGVHVTLSILGGISALMVPVPYVLYRWGPRIRKRSKFAVGEVDT